MLHSFLADHTRRYGHRFVKVRVGSTEKVFSAHEELLCAHSNYFKNRFQKGRKRIKDQCSICHDELDQSEKGVTWCMACGQNFHSLCIFEWLKKKETCPICRVKWTYKKDFQEAKITELDIDAFDVYIQWLYGSTIPFYKTDRVGTGMRDLRLMKAYLLGDVLEDKEFQKAILKEIVQHGLATRTLSGTDSVNFVYKNTDKSSRLRKFLVDLYIARGRASCFKVYSYPPEFKEDIMMVLFEQHKPSETKVNEMLAKYQLLEDDSTD